MFNQTIKRMSRVTPSVWVCLQTPDWTSSSSLFSHCVQCSRPNPSAPLSPHPRPVSPVRHSRTPGFALGQRQATFSQVQLQAPSLHQPVRRLQDLRSQDLRLLPLVRALAAPGCRFGHQAARGGRRLGFLAEAVEVLHGVLPSFASSAASPAGKHFSPESNAGADGNNSPQFYLLSRSPITRQSYSDEKVIKNSKHSQPKAVKRETTGNKRT